MSRQNGGEERMSIDWPEVSDEEMARFDKMLGTRSLERAQLARAWGKELDATGESELMSRPFSQDYRILSQGIGGAASPEES